jgi:hypothetical protein
MPIHRKGGFAALTSGRCGAIAGLAALALIAVGPTAARATAARATAARATAGQSAYPGSEGRIAFVRHGDIYSIRPDGTGLRQLSSGGRSSGPRWTPDGTRIAYLHAGNLWIMNANGSHKDRITRAAPTYTDSRPSWSPNGRYLAFVKTRAGHAHGYLTRYDTVTHTLVTFTAVMGANRAVKVTALPAPVAWHLAQAGGALDPYILFEGTGAQCGQPFTHCLDLLGLHRQSQYRKGFPSLEYGHTGGTRFLDPDWQPSQPYYATGVMVTVENCGAVCRHVGIEFPLTSPLPPVLLPGGYEAVFSPSQAHIAYVRPVGGTPEIFITSGGLTGPPGPGTELTRGSEPDWQPVSPFRLRRPQPTGGRQLTQSPR